MNGIGDKERLSRIINTINQKSPFQKKKLSQYLGEQDEEFWQKVEEFVLSYDKFLYSEMLDAGYLASAYLVLCRDMITEQVRFLETGEYPLSAKKTCNDLYNDRSEMISYMSGLALSQFLWKNHYAIYRFFNRKISAYADKTNSYLEIGPGHGLFLVEALRNTDCRIYEAVDISPTSVELSKKITGFMSDKADQIHFKESDIFDYQPCGVSFDFITIGEVLEHVAEPQALLRKIRSLLCAEGRAFITTCSNCPARDHVYLFRDVDEIRSMIRECGFDIEDELVLAVETVSSQRTQRYKLGHNYAAVLKRY